MVDFGKGCWVAVRAGVEVLGIAGLGRGPAMPGGADQEAGPLTRRLMFP